jgi:2'-5' RNA ligase
LRLFVAISPPPNVLDELAVAVAQTRRDWPELRWIGQERWHVTLAFLGEVDPARLDELRVRLERAAARHHAQRLRIGPGGAFPSPARARVLVAHVESADADLSGLVALARSVAAGARRAGAPPPDENRRYRPHLTLARVRQPTDLAALLGELSSRRGHPSAWAAEQIHLVESRLGPDPDYRTLATWPLRRTP